jgi:hypothetical protein
MSLDRSRLPDTLGFYKARGLKLLGRGKWRTTCCEFHGGSDSMRINVESGAFVCMAGCGAHGGDIVGYSMAVDGNDFVSAATALGAWVTDGEKVPTHRKPLAFHARDAIEVLAHEATIAAVAACNVANGAVLTEEDKHRLLQATNRITTIVGSVL